MRGTHHQGLGPIEWTLPLASLISFSTGSGTSSSQGLSPVSASQRYESHVPQVFLMTFAQLPENGLSCLTPLYTSSMHSHSQSGRACTECLPSEDQGAGSLSQRMNR